MVSPLNLVLVSLTILLTLWVTHLINKINEAYKRLSSLNTKLLRYSVIDPLTELYNYRYFLRVLHSTLERAKRYGEKFSVIKIDIELFKSINAIYGVFSGDDILRDFSGFLKSVVRTSDVLARLEDDEFGIIMSQAGKKEAVALGERIKETLLFRQFGRDKGKVNLRLSIGVVSFPEDGLSEIELLSLLDRCMEYSKDTGGKVGTSEVLGGRGRRAVDFDSITRIKDKISLIHTSLDKTAIESIFAFANAIKAKDLYTSEHTERTVKIASAIGEMFNFPPRRMEIIEYASRLHDLGKVGVPESVLLKPGRLSREEFEQIKKHPIIGVEILRPIHELSLIIPAILYHHEWFNGKGYPYGMAGKDIPLEARIIAVADCFQALISERPYRKAYSLEEAINLIVSQSEVHFDPEVVEVFCNVIEKLKEPLNLM